MKKVVLSIALTAGLAAMTGVNAMSISTEEARAISVLQDSGFVDVTLDKLNEKVQNAIRIISNSYDLKSLQYNSQEQITKVEGVQKENQSNKTFLLDAEGTEITEETISVEQQQETEGQQQTPSAEILEAIQDDGFVKVQLESLNKKVQAAIRAISEKFELNALQYNAEKKITKVEAADKETQSKKIFFLNEEGNEIDCDTVLETSSTEETETTEAPLFW